jgi:hypothetical protein
MLNPYMDFRNFDLQVVHDFQFKRVEIAFLRVCLVLSISLLYQSFKLPLQVLGIINILELPAVLQLGRQKQIEPFYSDLNGGT